MSDFVRQRSEQRKGIRGIFVDAYVPRFLAIHVHLRDVVEISARTVRVGEHSPRSVEGPRAYVTVYRSSGVRVIARTKRYQDIGILRAARKRQRGIRRPQIEGSLSHP